MLEWMSAAALVFGTAATGAAEMDAGAEAFALAASLTGVIEYTQDAPAAGPDANARAAPDSSDAAALAKQLSNPVADLISVPFQLNYDEGFGPKDAGRLLLNIQPVIPFSISEDWNVITRTIVPVLYEDSPADGVSSEFGLGNILQSFFFSPKDPIDGWIIGVGPAIQYATSTDDLFGADQWAAGPTAVFLRQEDGFTYGLLANHIWSFAGDSDADYLSNTYLQPFFTHTWPSAFTLGINTESTYDWNHEEWTVPINLFGAQVVHFGHQPVQFLAGGRYYADSPPGGPEWGLRFQVTLMFPK